MASVPTLIPTHGSPVQMPGAGGASNGQTPLQGVVPTGTAAGPIATAQQNPYVAPGVTGATGAVPGGGSLVQTQGGINWNNQDFSAGGDFNQTYGAGTGGAITSVLSNLGTATDSAIQATTAQVNAEAERQNANMQAGRAASGITPNSSAAALGDADFYAQVNTGLQKTISGMELNQQNTLLNALTNEGTAHGSDQSTFSSVMDVLSPALGIAGTMAKGASDAGMGSGSPGMSSFLTLLGALA